MTGHAYKCAAVLGTLILADAIDSGFVAGKLRVVSGQHRREPDQRVIPVERKTRAPQERPDVVAMTEVRRLMLDDMAQLCFIHRRFVGHIDGGTEKPEQAGRLNRTREIDLQAAILNIWVNSELNLPHSISRIL